MQQATSLPSIASHTFFLTYCLTSVQDVTTILRKTAGVSPPPRPLTLISILCSLNSVLYDDCKVKA